MFCFYFDNSFVSRIQWKASKSQEMVKLEGKKKYRKLFDFSINI